ncbi:UDP-2,4-diacetamido-2,4,6-trideoxy-beta-L-altropyranose hydrolase [Fodinicurvata fenggangensis]|uniref:UDP-2,4-diacetamido-2,4, 6-trideoxy-beta-L-altropyranose hydrolase n=1 Tax=Fodinicurvata fenggangensis TaxID=1121830 RepID=UPI0012DC5715|nr:UDP-2,4-diacetamido-2,4,6-trideoxy-beta-L-altropyranose hydrolase [Fodinicurvata fenggangensis]
MTQAALFRTDASRDIGGGHLRRCLTIADELAKRGWRCIFASCAESGTVVPALSSSGYEWVLVPENGMPSGDQLTDLDPLDLVIFDHYGLAVDEETMFRSQGVRVLVLDDLADRPHDCDLLVDPTLGRSEEDYRGLLPADARIMAGPDNAPLRPRFRELRAETLERRRQMDRPHRLLISLGSFDVRGLLPTLTEAVQRVDLDLVVDVVVGSGGSDLPPLSESFTLHGYVEDMAGLMAQADLAIGAGGTSSWERCCLGLPTLIVNIADNQDMITAQLVTVGAAIDLGHWQDLAIDKVTCALEEACTQPEKLQSISEKAAAICDDWGTLRILPRLYEANTNEGNSVTLRLVEEADCAMLFHWQQLPGIRDFSRTPAPPTWPEHEEWFEKKLGNDRDCFWIIQIEGRDCGVLRLDSTELDDVREVSIFVLPEYHGKGVARGSLELASRIAPARRLEATVLDGNLPSRKLFEAHGFMRECRNKYIKDLPTVVRQ